MHLPDIFSLVDAVHAAGAPIRANFRLFNPSSLKADNTPVTDVDLAVHQKLLDWTSTLSQVGYIGEEGDVFHRNFPYALYVDPLDGTAAYMRGLPVTTVAVSLMKRRSNTWWEPIMSVIHDPITRWTWAATKNGEGFVQQTRGNEHLYSPQQVVPRPSAWRVTAVAWRGAPCKLEAIRAAVLAEPGMEHQSFGATAIGGGLIASGLNDAVLFGGRSAVETAAMSLIVRGAGGVVTDLFGTPLESYELVEHGGKFDFLLPNGSIMSSSQALTDRLVELVKRVQ